MSAAGTARASLTAAIPVIPIVIPVIVHLLFVNFSLLYVWLPFTYLFSHVFILVIGLWAIHANTEVLPVVLFIIAVAMSVLLDIVQLGLYFPDQQSANGGGNTTSERTWQFSAAMTIINLLFKPVTIMLGILALFFRTGGSMEALGIRGGGGGGGEDNYNQIPENQQGGSQ